MLSLYYVFLLCWFDRKGYIQTEAGFDRTLQNQRNFGPPMWCANSDLRLRKEIRAFRTPTTKAQIPMGRAEISAPGIVISLKPHAFAIAKYQGRSQRPWGPAPQGISHAKPQLSPIKTYHWWSIKTYLIHRNLDIPSWTGESHTKPWSSQFYFSSPTKRILHLVYRCF